MAKHPGGQLLLGKHTPTVEEYSPQLLYPIPRSQARDGLGIGGDLPFAGVDVWHAYEMSWLDGSGKPVARVGRFSIPITSPNLVESKSFKLYLNSLNNMRFADDQAAQLCIIRDIGAAAGQGIGLELFAPDDPALAGQPLVGELLDGGSASVSASEPSVDMLIVRAEERCEERLYSHLLRSLCPVTGQPDWATVWLHYRGAALDHDALLAYIISYRQHQEFHEQCVERMFQDISERCQPDFLHIQALYTRRGGLDINPFRSTDPDAAALPRLNRQ